LKEPAAAAPAGVEAGLGDVCNVDVRMSEGFADPAGDCIDTTLVMGVAPMPGLLLLRLIVAYDGLHEGVCGDVPFKLEAELAELVDR